MKRILGLLVVMLLVSSCAPLILARTPRVLEDGQRKTSIAFGGSLPIGPRSECDRSTPEAAAKCPFEKIGPDYTPYAIPFTVDTAFGVGNNLEAQFSVGVGLYMLGFRLGGKALLVAEPFPVALDAGASLFVSNVVLDVGLLMAIPLNGWEPYLAVRGFYGHYWIGRYPDSLTGSLTVGAHLPSDNFGGGVFLELTLATAQFDRSFLSGTIVNTAFFITPAIGFRF